MPTALNDEKITTGLLSAVASRISVAFTITGSSQQAALEGFAASPQGDDRA
jgi:hypothetical protein